MTTFFLFFARRYGIMRKSIEYAPEESKAEIPFFREDQNLFVGSEMYLYNISLYENLKDLMQDSNKLINQRLQKQATPLRQNQS